jgi:hypothetical protein
VSAVFLRELRRLAPYGLGLTALAVQLIFWARARSFSADLSALSILAIPCFLGAASIAPDTSSGATAFLARLPIAGSRVLPVKVAAAALWTALGIALTVPLMTDHEQPWVLVQIAFFTFAAGVFASVLVSKTLPALLLAPLLAPGIALLGAAVVVLPNRLEAQPWFMLPFGAALGACAFLAFVRGDRHRASGRPAAIAFGSLALALLLGLGSTAAALAVVEDETADLEPVEAYRSLDGRILVVSLYEHRWYGPESRIAVIEAATGRAWLVPRRLVAVRHLSPDGRRLIVWDWEWARGWLADLETHELRKLSDGPYGTDSARDEVIWRGDRPLRVSFRHDGSATVTDLVSRREVAMEWPNGISVVGVATSRGQLLATDAESSIVYVDPPIPGGRSSTLVEPGVRCAELHALQSSLVAPSGERLLCPTKSHGVAVVDLAIGTTVPLDLHLPEGSPCVPLGNDARFSPDERRVAIRLGSSRVVFYDVATGRSLNWISPRSCGGMIWSPDGSKFADDYGDVYDVATGRRERRLAKCVRALLEKDLCIPASGPLVMESVATGDVVVRPLEVSR